MAVGQKLHKWTWMMDNVEVRGIVYWKGAANGTELDPVDSFNLELDPNYRHLVASMRGNNPIVPEGGPSGSIHVEAYSRRFNDPANINRVEPFALPDKPEEKFQVRVDRAGSKRPLRVGDHVRLFGRWIIENQHEDLCWTRKWGVGSDELKLKAGCVWAELHPFRWDSIELVEALDPERNSETLSLAAPVYEETYQRGGPDQTVVGHVFITDDRSNYHETMAATIYIKAPPLSNGANPAGYKVYCDEQVLLNGTGLDISNIRTVEIMEDGIKVTASVTAPPKIVARPATGGLVPQFVADINDPANNLSVFQARYTVWLALDTQELAGATVCSSAPNRLDVFAGDMQNTPYYQYYDPTTDSWSSRQFIDGILNGSPSAVALGPGLIYLFHRGMDNGLYSKYLSGGNQSGWQRQDIVASSAPAVCSSAPGRLDVFVGGVNNAVYYQYYDSTTDSWSSWQSLGGILNGNPTAVALGPGLIYVFHRGMDNALYFKYLSGGNQSNWQRRDIVASSAPAVCSSAPGRLDVFVRGADNALYYQYYDPNTDTWSNWRSLGGILTSAPSAVVLGPGLIYVFVRGADANKSIHYMYLSGGNQSAWRRLPN